MTTLDASFGAVGDTIAQRDPHLGPDAPLVVGGCLLEPGAELAVEDHADRAPVG